MRYACGCVNEIHAPSGVLRNVGKCSHHRSMRRNPATLDASYYEELGIIRDGELLPTKHVAELTEALGPFPEPDSHVTEFALEVGCGVSPYARAIREAGWFYVGIDPSPWAIGWMERHYGRVRFIGRVNDFETKVINVSYGFILAAHCLEHMEDAPGAIAKCSRLLEPGGELWIIVPDDSDPVNPDHLWFFTGATLRSCLGSAGLIVDRMAVRRHVPHENFIYARARKAQE